MGGSGLSGTTAKNLRIATRKDAAKPTAGCLTTVAVDGGNMDGYTMYLPKSFDDDEKKFPILVAWLVAFLKTNLANAV